MNVSRILRFLNNEQEAMKILAINGSTNDSGSNSKLLRALKNIQETLELSRLVHELPLFQVDLDRSPLPESVIAWRNQLQSSGGIIICTPEYIHGIPAQLKNALEWATTSGEFKGKKVLAITFTPHPPRGEKAMKSLLWSLQALEANVIASVALYQTEVVYSESGHLTGDILELLTEALNLFA